MIWPNDISFEAFQRKKDYWYADKHFELCGPPIDAQFALDLIFKTLVDDKDHYSYLTIMPESNEQINSIMLELILRKYSRKYRKFKRLKKEEKMALAKKCDRCGKFYDEYNVAKDDKKY